MNKNKRYGVIINPKGVTLSSGDVLHYGQTLDIIGNREFLNCYGYDVLPHGLNKGLVALCENDVRVTSET